MKKNRRKYDSAEDYNDEYNPSENYDFQDEYDGLEDKWYDIEDDYRKRYTNITDDDVYYEGGNFNYMIDNVARRRGKTRYEIRNEIENW